MRIKRTDGTKATPESIDAIVNAARAEGQRSENRDQGSGIRDQGSGVRGQEALSLQLSVQLSASGLRIRLMAES
jgi:hypothetical protein